jgi:hypothetical protein
MNDKAKTKMGHNSKDHADYESLNPINPNIRKALTRIFDEIKEPSKRAMDMLLNLMSKFTEYGSGLKALTDKEADWNTRAAYHNRQMMEQDPNPDRNKKFLRKLYSQKKLTAEDKYDLRKQIDEELWEIYELVSDADCAARVFEDKDDFAEFVEAEEDRNDKKN